MKIFFYCCFKPSAVRERNFGKKHIRLPLGFAHVLTVSQIPCPFLWCWNSICCYFSLLKQRHGVRVGCSPTSPAFFHLKTSLFHLHLKGSFQQNTGYKQLTMPLPSLFKTSFHCALHTVPSLALSVVYSPIVLSFCSLSAMCINKTFLLCALSGVCWVSHMYRFVILPNSEEFWTLGEHRWVLNLLWDCGWAWTSRFSCHLLPSARTEPGLGYGVLELEIQGLVHARQAHNQLSHIPCPAICYQLSHVRSPAIGSLNILLHPFPLLF